MPGYRVHRLKTHLRQNFRFAPHVSGTADVKPRDYEPGETVEASSPYAAFFALRDGHASLQLGDLLESEDQSLRIYKYVGFEEARWVLPQPKADPDAKPEPDGKPDAAANPQVTEVLAAS